MRTVVQRVSQAKVSVGDRVEGEIGAGILLLLGIGGGDTEADADYILNKTLELRIFPDDEGKMNHSLREKGGGLLVVSQFTLYGDCRKGRRPSYSDAMAPAQAEALYERFLRLARDAWPSVATGRFQAMMDVNLVNDGPVTVLLDSRRTF